jgi:hypothetical protein
MTERTAIVGVRQGERERERERERKMVKGE